MASSTPRVQPGSFLTLHYRLAGPGGDIINTFADKPATLTLGTGELSPAVEQRLLGLEEGARAQFEIPAGEAFGERNPEMVQWVDHLLFKVGGKMFAIMSLEPTDVVLSFKATPEQFYELQEQDGIIPAPYMARAQWLALQRFDALRDDDLRDVLAISHRLIFEKLPKESIVGWALPELVPEMTVGEVTV